MAKAEAALSRPYPRMAKIVDFSPERVKAPFFLRVAALFVDYMIMVAVPTLWLVLSKLIDSTSAVTVGTTIWAIAATVFILNFLLLPLLTGKSVGKMLTGLTILRNDGSDVGLWHLLLRITVGFLLTVLTLGLGFLLAAVNSSGRALHDFVAGTIVVRGRKTLV
jgi:Mce-associated membrane protein